eukprot:3265935-Pyramimonas_sp.AAC.1
MRHPPGLACSSVPTDVPAVAYFVRYRPESTDRLAMLFGAQRQRGYRRMDRPPGQTPRDDLGRHGTAGEVSAYGGEADVST